MAPIATATPALIAPIATATPPDPSPTASAVATASPLVPPLVDGRPGFSDVSQATPRDVVALITGQNPRYPGSEPSQLQDFSPSDILETIDTIVLDRVRQARGDVALARVHQIVAADILSTLHDLYGDRWVLLALDAGHGGKKGFFWDPGSEGTEAVHTRAVVAALDQLAPRAENARIIVRHIFNDNIADDFGFPNGASANRATVAAVFMRQARAAMLAMETRAWNAAHPAPDQQVFLHEISVHFNAGAGGALVLHQGTDVSPEFQQASISFGKQYLHRVVPDLNASSLLPAPLTLWGGAGLHDDVMMYTPAYMNHANLPASFIPKYGVLQASGYMPRFIKSILALSTPGADSTVTSAPLPPVE